MRLILFLAPRPALDHMLCQIEIKMQSNPIDFSEITCDSVPYICLSMCFIGYNRQKLFMTQISWTFTGTISTLKGRRKLVGKANRYRNVDGEVINISFLLYIHTHTQMALHWECTHPEHSNYTLRIGFCCNALQEIFKFIVGKKFAFTI